jgi:hypothetical protein
MSLETTIEENTKAVLALTAALVAKYAAEAKDPKPLKNAATTLKEEETHANIEPSPSDVSGDAKKPSEQPETSKSSLQSVPTGESSLPALIYDDIKELIYQLSKEAGRDKTVALLARYGAKNGKEVKEDRYVEFVADGKRVLAGEYDPEAAE